jgi:nicotinamidase-related amidase
MTEHEQFIGILRAKNESPIHLEPSRTALIVVDMQRFFTQSSFPFIELFERLSPGSCSGYLRRVREVVIPNIQRLLSCFRDWLAQIFHRHGQRQRRRQRPAILDELAR